MLKSYLNMLQVLTAVITLSLKLVYIINNKKKLSLFFILVLFKRILGIFNHSFNSIVIFFSTCFKNIFTQQSKNENSSAYIHNAVMYCKIPRMTFVLKPFFGKYLYAAVKLYV